MRYITIALAKGRLAENAAKLFLEIGFSCEGILGKSRKLIFTDEENKAKFILVKAGDVPTYVEYGAADIGVVGKDTIMEEGRSLFEMIKLPFGECKMAVAGREEMRDKFSAIGNLRVASKYPKIAKDYFHVKKGQTAEIIKLGGSVELAPLTGLAEVIVDIVESGKTLRENGLVVLEEICDLSARLIVNRASAKTEKARVMEIVKKINEKLGDKKC